MKNSEQEREDLRIENQRLRDELSDLKVEAEIVQEKLRHTEGHGYRRRKPTPLYRSPSTPQTLEIFDRSPGTTASSPVFATPPAKSTLTQATATPPSPPISESSASLRKSINATPTFPRARAAGPEGINSRSLHNARTQPRPTHSRTSSLAYSNGRSTPSMPPSRPSMSKPTSQRPSGLPTSGSLYQIRGLIGKMQKLEERVQSAKSRLPAPSETSSRGSPRSRSGSVIGDSSVPSTVTVRRASRKRLSGSSVGSSVRDSESTPSYLPQSRQSFGARTQGDSRPSSRTSYSSRSSFSQSVHSGVPIGRPESRQSRPGAKTPLGHYSTNPTTESRRPRSSLSNPAPSIGNMTYLNEDRDVSTPSARKTQDLRRPSLSATPNGLKKRATSGVSAIPTPRSFKSSIGSGNMPSRARTPPADIGETY